MCRPSLRRVEWKYLGKYLVLVMQTAAANRGCLASAARNASYVLIVCAMGHDARPQPGYTDREVVRDRVTLNSEDLCNDGEGSRVGCLSVVRKAERNMAHCLREAGPEVFQTAVRLTECEKPRSRA